MIAHAYLMLLVKLGFWSDPHHAAGRPRHADCSTIRCGIAPSAL